MGSAALMRKLPQNHEFMKKSHQMCTYICAQMCEKRVMLDSRHGHGGGGFDAKINDKKKSVERNEA